LYSICLTTLIKHGDVPSSPLSVDNPASHTEELVFKFQPADRIP